MAKTKKAKPAPPPADEVIVEIETAAAAKGYSVDDICKASGFGRASWQRWKYKKAVIHPAKLAYLRATIANLPVIGDKAPDRRLKEKDVE